MLWSGYEAFKGGDFWQNGGELIFREGRCVWVHRMETTADHLTAEELVKVLSGTELSCREVLQGPLETLRKKLLKYKT